MPVARICQTCQCVFHVSPCRVAKGDAKYCSKACYWASSPRIEYRCDFCHGLFLRRYSSIQRRTIRHNYCSRACFTHARHASFIFQTCARCGKEFLVDFHTMHRDQKYCSRACMHPVFLARFWANVQCCEHRPWCLYCCWPWTGTIAADGYGVLVRAGRQERAHRISWELHNQRALPRNNRKVVVQHLCHNPPCVNPWHLAYGSQQRNIADAIRLGHFQQHLPKHMRAR